MVQGRADPDEKTAGRSNLVRKKGLEPPCLSAPEPKSGASTNSATFAVKANYTRSQAPPDGAHAAAGDRYNPEYSSVSPSPLPVEHYENFPVASWLLPQALRTPIVVALGSASIAALNAALSCSSVCAAVLR